MGDVHAKMDASVAMQTEYDVLMAIGAAVRGGSLPERVAYSVVSAKHHVSLRRVMSQPKRTYWTAYEDKLVMRMVDLGASYSEVASILGRTEASIGNRIWKIRKAAKDEPVVDTTECLTIR